MERHYSNSVFDFAKKQQLGFQDPATPSMEGIIDLHHDLMFFLTIIVIFVLWLLISVVYYFYLIDENANEYEDVTIISSLKSHNVVLEIVWTVVPSLILLLIALPSFALIYSMDELLSPSITLKVIGHQWYWSYEYNHPLPAPGIQNVLKPTDLDPTCSVEKIFDSNMVLEEDLLPGQLRLLEVNNRTYLPTDVNIRVLITSADVLHSWAIPSLGIKVDACPGRLNQSPLFIKRAGVFYGQCSEICGVNHAFMPIVVHAVNPIEYLTWFHKAYTIKEI
jgi:cytochrome c oxidase subunit 2